MTPRWLRWCMGIATTGPSTTNGRWQPWRPLHDYFGCVHCQWEATGRMSMVNVEGHVKEHVRLGLTPAQHRFVLNKTLLDAGYG